MALSAYGAPGKVLILGGYAVLERPNAGVVLAVNAYFRCIAEWKDDTSSEKLPAGALKVKVTSEQWGGWKGTYLFDTVNGLVPDLHSKERNPYVEKPLAWTLYCMLTQKPAPSMPVGKILNLTLLADNDFYSQQENLAKRGLKRTAEGLRGLPQNVEVINKSAKTGLGSSAAMISSIVSCVMHFLCGFLNLEDAHRIAQLCHAAVQGKIGSGFDICCAFYGSMKYIRYDPTPLNECLSTMSSPTATFPETGKALVDCIHDKTKWNHEIEPCRLPQGIELLCADIAGGSETPSMSKKILEWKAKSDGMVWKTLITRNDQARESLNALYAAQEEDGAAFAKKVDEFSQLKSSEWSGVDSLSQKFIACHRAFLAVRESLRLIGELSGVPVEPKDQTMLCDASLDSVPGVLACGVPGAGGFDAVFALVLGPTAAKRLEIFWEEYSAKGKASVCALLLREARDDRGGGIRFDLPVPDPKKVKGTRL